DAIMAVRIERVARVARAGIRACGVIAILRTAAVARGAFVDVIAGPAIRVEREAGVARATPRTHDIRAVLRTATVVNNALVDVVATDTVARITSRARPAGPRAGRIRADDRRSRGTTAVVGRTFVDVGAAMAVRGERVTRAASA